MTAASRIALVSWFFFFVGCGDVSYSTEPMRYSGVVNTCKKNKDCGDGYQCDADYLLCVLQKGAANRELYLKVIPRHYTPQVFAVTFDESGFETIDFYSQKKVETAVLTDEGLAIESRILVTDLQGIPGYPLDIATTNVSQSKSTATLSLFEGENRYRVDVIPKSGTDYPPRYFDSVSVVWDDVLEKADFMDVDGGDLSTLSLLQGATELRGEIRRGEQPAQGLTVEITDPDTGRALSTRAVTGCLNGEDESTVCGDFILQRAASDELYQLKIWNASDPSYPVVTIPSTAATIEDTVPVFSLSPLSNPVRFGARVERPQILASGNVVHDGIEDCLVVFESETTAVGRESVFLNAKTDSTGNMISLSGDPWLYLYPGYYQLTVIPPEADPAGSEDFSLLTDSRQIDSTGVAVDNQVFILNFRYRASVRVTAKGKSVPGTIIEAVPLNHPSEYAMTGYSVPQDNGTHRIWLDAGRYRLTAKVPYESGFAYGIREILVEESGDTALAPQEIVLDDIQVPAPSAAKLHVESAGVEMNGAIVEWYEQMPGTPVILVGRSVVDQDGNTVGLLPPR